MLGVDVRYHVLQGSSIQGLPLPAPHLLQRKRLRFVTDSSVVTKILERTLVS